MGRRAIVALPLVLAFAAGVRGQIVPEGFHSETLVDTGLNSPTCMCVAPDGTIYIAEKQGALLVWREGSGLLPGQFFSGAPLEVNSAGERGLIGVALDPDFESNRYVYVHYTASSPDIHGRISRFTADASGELALAVSEVVLLDLNPLAASNHNGGALHFGPDGMLFVGVGENAVASNSQSTVNLLGKILRINPEPGNVIPPDNPTSFPGISGSPTGDNRAIWAVGLRNPFTFAFQPGTGRMFINDVGAGSYEEIDEGLAGRNYGWPETEGSFDEAAFPNFTHPVFTYSHIPIGAVWGRCIAGGTFYNPHAASFPLAYVGDYFFADYAENWIKRLDPATGEVIPFAWEVGNVVDIRVDPQGRLVFVEIGGELVRVDYQPGNAQPALCNIFEDQGLYTFDAEAGDGVGYSVAIDESTAILGAPYQDHSGGSSTGSAYVFSRTGTTWNQSAKLTASDAAPGDELGTSVAISGDTVIVGSWLDDHAGGANAGSAYVFVRDNNNWTQQSKLVGSDAATSDGFGSVVALYGDTAVVGADGSDHAGETGTGAAYVFIRTDGVWSEQAKLTASDAAADDHFGSWVTISGETIVVGSVLDDHVGGADAGSAYIFTRSGSVWTEQAKLTASDAEPGDRFGIAAIDGSTIVVSSYLDDHDALEDAGSAYVFVCEDGMWTEQAKLVALDSGPDDWFGRAVAVEGQLILVGANLSGHVGGGPRSGGAYVFVRSAGVWAERSRLLASGAGQNDQFGISVALSDPLGVIGAVFADSPNAVNSGAAYTFGTSQFTIPGDLDGDGYVGGADMEVFVDVLIDLDADPDHVARADLDCSGTADGLDVSAYVMLFLSG